MSIMSIMAIDQNKINKIKEMDKEYYLKKIEPYYYSFVSTLPLPFIWGVFTSLLTYIFIGDIISGLLYGTLFGFFINSVLYLLNRHTLLLNIEIFYVKNFPEYKNKKIEILIERIERKEALLKNREAMKRRNQK